MPMTAPLWHGLIRHIYPPLVFALALLATLLLHWLVPVALLIPEGWRWLAVIPALASLALAAAAFASFGAAKTTVIPFMPASALVTSGPYTLTRNPMYLSLSLILAALAIVLGSLTPWLGVIGYVVAMDRLIIPEEEHLLSATFGTAYETYRRTVRRWL